MIINGDALAVIVNPISYEGLHFATFPPLLCEVLITATTSEHGVCPRCGAPWNRLSEKHYISEKVYELITIGWVPSCKCGILETIPSAVLVIFHGSGSCGIACKRTGRTYNGIEYNINFIPMSEKRINSEQPPLYKPASIAIDYCSTCTRKPELRFDRGL